MKKQTKDIKELEELDELRNSYDHEEKAFNITASRMSECSRKSLRRNF